MTGLTNKKHVAKLAILVMVSSFLIGGLATAVAGPLTSNSTQPEELKDKLEAPASCARCHASIYTDWSGSMMGNDWRDPAFLALLSISEQDVPGVGDYCLRCHAAGWFEGRSEPPKGDFLGKGFRPAPSIDRESIPLCDFCHRAERVGLKKSVHDGTLMAEGNGSVYFRTDDPWKGGKHPLKPLHKSSDICGACHDVSSPNDSKNSPGMQHPLERTYTEWRFSNFGQTGMTCQACHPPMKFPGAQTWILDPGMAELYPDIDAPWVKAGYSVRKDRAFAWKEARSRNEAFMRRAADIGVSPDGPIRSGTEASFSVTVTNLTGHRLPTGFAEGRQMWVHLRVTDAAGEVVFEDGHLDKTGALVRTKQTKVYEQKAAADGEKSFHFAKIDEIIKDNRIPPAGFDTAAYEKQGAFIIGAKYADRQNWDETKYVFDVPDDVKGPLIVRARLLYETMSKEYVDWLVATDKTKGKNFGGKAAATPDGSKTWAITIQKLWERAAKGRPVLISEVAIRERMVGTPDLTPLLFTVLAGLGIALVGLRFYRRSR